MSRGVFQPLCGGEDETTRECPSCHTLSQPEVVRGETLGGRACERCMRDVEAMKALKRVGHWQWFQQVDNMVINYIVISLLLKR